MEVSAESVGSYRVSHQGVGVAVSDGELQVAAQAPNLETLNTARQIAARAIESLPETPLKACGFNLRYRSSDPPNELLQATQCPIDAQLSNEGFEIVQRTLGRSVRFEDGVLNVTVRQVSDQNTWEILLNFHCDSARREDHQRWLGIPNEDVSAVVDRVLSAIRTGPIGG